MPGAVLARLTFCSAVGGPVSLVEKLSASREDTSVGAEAKTERMRSCPAPAIGRPLSGGAMAGGYAISASVARPPSPLDPAPPRPATVEIMPDVFTRRMRLFLLSAI